MCDKPKQCPEVHTAEQILAIKKKLDAYRLEERKKQGEYMKILRDGVR